MSEFLAGLRARVGHDLLVLPSVTACVFDDDGRLLLACHAEAQDLWAPPGGIVEPDEDPADAVVREIHEELGLEIRVHGIIGAYGGPEFRVEYPNGDKVSYVTTLFACTANGDTIRPDGVEISAARWCSAADAAALRTPRWVPLALPDCFDWWRQTRPWHRSVTGFSSEEGLAAVPDELAKRGVLRQRPDQRQ
ncbi:MAG TPA: NUDIX domain-containing protein [Thermopolyspora sp.]|jgi:ADP-ribose pyrophosphatase